MKWTITQRERTPNTPNKRKNSLLIQRFFWGALAGCLSTILVAGSPYLANMELSMLGLRYKIADKLSASRSPDNLSHEITLVPFDDFSQFELGTARFNDKQSQASLARAIENIERCAPSIVVVDLDLRGATSQELADVFKRYRNVVLALFGSLEGSTDLPAPIYLTNAAAFGYDELPERNDGKVSQLPVNYREVGPGISASDQTPLAPVPSLTEAVIALNRSIHGVGPDSHFLMSNSEQPIYFSYRKFEYPTFPLVSVLDGHIANKDFANRIVMIGNTFTPRHLDRKQGEDKTLKPDLVMHADAISTLLNNEQISTFYPQAARLLILLLGALAGGLASVLGLFARSTVFLGSAGILAIMGQWSFQVLKIAIPIAPPLAILLICFILGTFIYLDAGLREKNLELAEARESMQVRAEEERQRIAEDLHDETLPALSAVARMADKLNRELGNNPVPLEMRQRLDFSVSEMRRVINDLHPSVLETMGFKPALENLLAELARDSGIQTRLLESKHFDDEKLSKFSKLQLYRIVQEALNNVQKHAEAKNVGLNISLSGDRLILSIIDDGKGMPNASINGQSHGILNIKQRAQLLGAKVDWRCPSKNKSGVEVRIELPINGNKENC